MEVPETGKKPRKVPCHPEHGYEISAHDPDNWMSHADAQAAAQKYSRRVGFVLCDDDPYFFYDLDACRDHATGNYTPEAYEILKSFADLGAAAEVSISGTGYHVMGRCDQQLLKDRAHKFDSPGRSGEKWQEFYTTKRFVALGYGFSGDFDVDCSAQLLQHVPTKEQAGEVDFDGEFDPRYTGRDWSIEKLKDKMLAASDRQSAAPLFNGPLPVGAEKIPLRAFWVGSEIILAQRYASSNDAFDRSAALMAFLHHLAFWCGRNADLMNRVLRESPFWNNYTKRHGRDALLRDEIEDARARVDRVYDFGTPDRENPRPLYTLAEMEAHLVMVGGTYTVDLQTKEAYLNKAAAVVYAACETETIDDKGKPKSIPALPVWIKSKSAKFAQVATWRPNHSPFCASPDGKSGVNLWRGFDLMLPPLDYEKRIKSFLDLVKYLFPVEEESRLFLQWLAHAFQHPDILPHFGFFHVSPITGTGRGTLAEIISETFKGYVALSCQPEMLLGTGFNGPLSQKIFAIVDEIRIGTGGKYDRIDAVKSMLTASHRVINNKYGAMVVEQNCTRWFVCSNHDDGMAFDETDRRWVFIKGPDHKLEESFYAELHRLKHDPLFIASIQTFLYMYSLEGFNPGMHAPRNEMRAVALDSLRSEAEKAVIDFAANWPGDLAGMYDLKSYIASRTDEMPKDAALNHMVRRAGIRQTGIQLRRTTDKWCGVLIVNTAINKDDIAKMAPSTIKQQIIDAANAFRNAQMAADNDYGGVGSVGNGILAPQLPTRFDPQLIPAFSRNSCG